MSSHVGEPAALRASARSLRRGLALAALLIVLIVARMALPLEAGLRGDYFSETAGSLPVVSAVDPVPSTAAIERQWPTLPSDIFRVSWFGFIAVDRPGAYTFTITADDGAALTIDGNRLIDTGADRGTFIQSGTVTLARGLHPVLLEYRQSGGAYRLEWTWAHAGEAAVPVPARQLVVRRSAWPAQRAALWLDRSIAALALVFCIWALVRYRRAVVTAPRRYPAAALLLLFVAFAIVQTWPLASDPSHLSRNDNSDTILNEWALAWVAHQAIHDPLHLFDANIFYPERFTLAFSESMIVQAAIGAPLFWAGWPPVLVYNLLLIAGFALNGWVMTLVVRRWTGSTIAGITAGILFAFNSNILTRMPHMQALHVEFLPLALFAWDLLLRQPRVRHALFFGAMVALQSLTSVYLLVFTFSAVSAAVLARAREWAGPRFRKVAPQVLLAAAVAAIMAVPFLLPYLWVNQEQGFERSLDDARNLAANIGSYLSSPSRLHYGLWSYRWFNTSSSALFPGIAALLLAGVAAVRGVAFRDRRARLGLALIVAGVLLSLGPKVPGYALLFTYVPIYRVVRVTSSFGYLALTGLAIVAGFGMLELRSLLPGRRWRLAAAVLLAAAFVESLSTPIELTRVNDLPRIYDLLRDEPAAVVVEVPFYTASAGFQQAQYMLNSTRHWRPMLNGYSGYRPLSYYETGAAISDFPSPASIDWLRRKGVTHVFVHVDAYDGPIATRLASTPGLKQIAVAHGVVLYRLESS